MADTALQIMSLVIQLYFESLKNYQGTYSMRRRIWSIWLILSKTRVREASYTSIPLNFFPFFLINNKIITYNGNLSL